MSHTFLTLDTFDTEYSADSVEWCPAKLHQDIFACGTYQLLKDEQIESNDKSMAPRRLGRLYLMKILDRGKIKLLQQIEEAAILDMKWSQIPWCNKTLLGIVTAKGQLKIYELNECGLSLQLIMESEISDDNETLALSLDWCAGKTISDNSTDLQIIVSDSKGQIYLYILQGEGLKKVASWNAHEYEAWIAAFDYWDTKRIYTGGDDCKLKCFDTRMGDSPVMLNSIHNAGVTSLHSNSRKEYLLASGSYDEILRLWDVRHFKKTVSETNLKGGIWRLKWDPLLYQNLLAACMYGGFRVIDCQNVEAAYIIDEYNEHDSISYGCDWSLLNNQEMMQRNILMDSKKDIRLIATCSFYDHQLKVSAVRLNSE